MKIYALNLHRAPNRRVHVAQQLDRCGIPAEIVPAIDGRDIVLSDNQVVDPFAIRAGLLGDRPPAIASGVGCALSHLEVYRRILLDGHGSALVVEDDVVLPPDLDVLTGAIARHMTGAAVTLLHFSHPGGPCKITSGNSVALPGSRLLVYPVDTRLLASAAAYVITAEACRRLTTVAPPVRSKADAWELFRSAGAVDSIRCVVPMPVTVALAFRSTIDYYSSNSMQARFREQLGNVNVPFVKQLLAFRRGRSFRRRGWTGEYEFADS